MNKNTPNCIEDIMFSNTTERDKLELILSRKLPFPHRGTSGILVHGVWGSGKTTLAELIPCLLETAYSETWDMTQGAGQMPASNSSEIHTEFFRCGGGLSTTSITNTINNANSVLPVWHHSNHDYFVFDEVDKLTLGAQQSLKSAMGLKRCIFIFTTNYLNKVDGGIIDRCHLVEMNQAPNPNAYLPLAQSLITSMGLSATAISTNTLISIAVSAKGSLRDFSNGVILESLKAGGSLGA